MPNVPLIQAALEQAVKDGVFPGAVLAVRYGGCQADMFTAGLVSILDVARAVQSATVYDLASLTKPLSTVTGLVLLIQAGRCQLHDRVESILPELAGSPMALEVVPNSIRILRHHIAPLAICCRTYKSRYREYNYTVYQRRSQDILILSP